MINLLRLGFKDFFTAKFIALSILPFCLSIFSLAWLTIWGGGEIFDLLSDCAKNVLNRFRQNNGYKEGSYKKNWNGREDNEVMSEILSNGVSTIDEIYAALEREYKKVR